MFPSPLHLFCGVIVSMVLLSHPTRSSMHAPNIYKLTIILFERIWSIVTCLYVLSPLVINVQIFLPKVFLHFSYCVTSFWSFPTPLAWAGLLRKYLSFTLKLILYQLQIIQLKIVLMGMCKKKFMEIEKIERITTKDKEKFSFKHSKITNDKFDICWMSLA